MPVDETANRYSYARLTDGLRADSALSCHCIITPRIVALRTDCAVFKNLSLQSEERPGSHMLVYPRRADPDTLRSLVRFVRIRPRSGSA